MELIEIKQILKEASVEVDIQGRGKCIAVFESDFERVAIEIKKLTIPDDTNCISCGIEINYKGLCDVCYCRGNDAYEV